MYIIDIVKTSNSNPIIYILFVILFIVIIAILLLLYLQNKEIREKMVIQENNQEQKDSVLEEQVLEDNIESINESNELQNLSKELENLPKKHTIDMTQYEMEQEKTAIISYDELVKQAQEDKKLDYEINTENSVRDNEISKSTTYQHEEEFLNSLKELKKSLN